MRLLELRRTRSATAASALSISGCRTSACACEALGQLREGAQRVALGPVVDRELLGELAGPPGEVADVAGGLLEGALGGGDGLVGGLEVLAGGLLGAAQGAGDGVDLGPELLGGREALHALQVLAGPDGELALEGVDGALGELERLGGAIDLGLGGGQLALERGDAGVDGGQLDASLVGAAAPPAPRRARAGGARRGRRAAASSRDTPTGRMPTASRASARGACSDGGRRAVRREQGFDLVAGVDAEEVGGHAAGGGPARSAGGAARGSIWVVRSSASRARVASKCSRSAAGRAGSVAAARPPLSTTSR